MVLETIDKVANGTHLFGKAVSIAVLVVSTVTAVYAVFLRYVLQSAPRWTGEFGILMLLWITFVGGATAYIENEHVSVEYFHNRMTTRNALVTTVLINLSILVVGGYLASAGVELTMNSASDNVPVLQGISQLWYRLPLFLCGVILTVECVRRLKNILVELSEL